MSLLPSLLAGSVSRIEDNLGNLAGTVQSMLTGDEGRSRMYSETDSVSQYK
jgi:hypothetical protein